MTDEPAVGTDPTTPETDLLPEAVAFAPAACNLPTAQRPIRAAEFLDLLGRQVIGVQDANEQHTRFALNPDPEVASTTADLFTRETQCCSFFTFTLTATGGSLTLDVEVPPSQVGVLAALSGMAGAGATP
jgi:hypothetical protein